MSMQKPGSEHGPQRSLFEGQDSPNRHGLSGQASMLDC